MSPDIYKIFKSNESANPVIPGEGYAVPLRMEYITLMVESVAQLKETNPGIALWFGL